MLTELRIQSLWGQVFEIAVKRGVLTALLASEVRRRENLPLGQWPELSLRHVHRALAQQRALTDPNQKAQVHNTARHLFQMGMGLGQTAIREYLATLCEGRRALEDYRIQALWCPLQLPTAEGISPEEEERLHRDFQAAFDLIGPFDTGLARKGHPLWADFLLWLEPELRGCPRELLCLEFSLNGRASTLTYAEPAAHLEDLARYAWFVEARGVFSRVCAEVSGETFALSPTITDYLPAFTSRDKPLYKLCQAASYIDRTVHWLEGRGFTHLPLRARALSITQNGFESLGARYFEPAQRDPRVDLIRTLGQAYRKSERHADDADGDLSLLVRGVYERVRKALPTQMRAQLRDLAGAAEPGAPVSFDASETISEFRNLMDLLTREEIDDLVGGDPVLAAYFGQDARTAIGAALPSPTNHAATLRDVHAAAVIAGLHRARPGELTVLGLEGNPGIGKTTAVVNWLKAQRSGYLFLYASPRVIINDDVTGKLARGADGRTPTGVLTMTTNAKLIGTARNWYREQVSRGLQPPREIDSAVVIDGVTGLEEVTGSTLLLLPPQREALELAHTDASFRKRAETERQDRVYHHRSPGVLRVLAKTTRAVLRDHPQIDKVVLTAAIQAYRDLQAGKSTLAALAELFGSKVSTTPGRREREAFAQRIPTIVVMVDELTGDGAGALFAHDMARWLDEQFLEPFTSAPRFRVILVVSDASLGNEVVMERFLQSGRGAPDKVLVSESRGNRPFRLALSSLRLGGRTHQTLHVMTNSFPAGTLTLDYRVRMDPLTPEARADGKLQTVRQAISTQQGDMLLRNAAREIERALMHGADQVIFFAQDKAFLRALETLLTAYDEEHGAPPLREGQVAILDSSVPAYQRKELIAPARRDQVKVFLMTSSGARGVSFPKTDWIIAQLPRFNVEAALMEVAQLIYRGRGGSYATDDGSSRQDGDVKDRHLVMLLQDFLPLARDGDEEDPRRWLRRISDVLTFLVMLRATIYTRITGDAGLDKRRIALVPVGGITSDAMLSLMSTQLRTFLSESQVLLADSRLRSELVGRLIAAERAARKVFSNCQLVGSARRVGHRSMVRSDDLARFSRHASADNAPLLPDAHADPDVLLPAHLYCVGPFWLESWADLVAEERFRIEGWLTNMNREVAQLYGTFKGIADESAYPSRLRRPAEELYRLLGRTRDEAMREFSTVKELDSSLIWLALPVDYPRFWKEQPDGRYPSLGDHEEWRSALACCLGPITDTIPVIGLYEDIPFVAGFGLADPGRFGLVFDDRYLAASNELNLLNTILLAPTEE